MSDTIQRYIAELQQTDSARQAAAAQSLASLAEEAQPALVALVQACSSQNEAVLNWCTAALEDVGPPELQQIEDLALLAQSASSDVAYWAVTLLGRARDQGASAVSVLVERLNDSSAPQVQRRAAWALGEIGHGASSAVATLRTVAEGSDGPLANQAQRAIERIEVA
ncbi:MAG: HEAT repeat domain-containing protein [Planctomycetes bacterium]|nr:HEAT repeat domain-containing protein [Planctomycetota bacterium]